MKFLARLRYVVGVDPGLSTGLYAVRLTGDARRVKLAARFQGNFGEALRGLRAILDDAREFDEEVIIAGERYTVTSRTGKRTAQPLPQKILGAVEALADDYPNATFILQAPADAKKLADNERLRDLGFYTFARDVNCPDANDVNDAARHVLLALARKRASIFDDLLRQADRRKTESQR